eukprot:10231756-Lingulodinium_polyedra.AAC.1
MASVDRGGRAARARAWCPAGVLTARRAECRARSVAWPCRLSGPPAWLAASSAAADELLSARGGRGSRIDGSGGAVYAGLDPRGDGG